MKINEKNKEKYLYLNILKTISIIMVCSYHFCCANNTIYSNDMSIYNIIGRFFINLSSICIPLFIMVNGALLLNQEFSFIKHLKRILKMFSIYYIWRVIYLFIIAKSLNIDLLSKGIDSLVNYLVLGDFERSRY